MITRRLLAFSAVALLTLAAWSPLTTAQGGASISLTALDTPYAQDFDTLAFTGTSSVVPPGWLFSESAANANATYTAGTGSANAGDTYSFGAASSPERAFGGLQSGSLVPAIGALFTNNTGETITSLEIAYTGEQWRLGTADRVDRIDVEYSQDATSLTTGLWVPAPALAFLSPTTAGPAGPRDGNLDGNQAPVAATITGLAIPHGNTFAIRWIDANATGADDGLAVDDFALIPHGGGAATVSIADTAVTEGNTGTMTATFTVSVSTAAHDGVTFSIATANSGGIAPAMAGDDYVARAETGVLIPAGETAYAFAVTINGDTGVEPDETFAVQLSEVSGALSGDATAVGTIVNDDEPPPVLTDVVISQVYGAGGNSGATLTHDFVELFNPGAAPVPLDGWSVQYTSAAGTGTWQMTPLVGTIQPGSYFLVQMAAGTGGTQALPTPDATGTIAMAAGAGKVALQTNATAIVGGCPLQATADLVGYGAASCFEGTAPTGQLSVSTAAIRKRGGCFDSDQNGVDFSVAPPTPRNSAAPARSCVAVPAQIHDIQGPGAVSPLAGQDVITTGIVTGIKANGFFLQAADDAVDAEPATSEGLFAFTSATPAVAVGNVVSARGTVSEFFGLTQIESSLPGDVTVTTSATVPAPVALTPSHLDPAGPHDQLERFEGMRLSAASLTSVAPTDGFGEIPAVLSGVARPVREPGIPVNDPVPPDPTTGDVDCCIPRFDGNPERIVIDSDGLVGSTALTVTSNVALGGVTGPLDFSFGAYKLLPETAPTAGVNMTGRAVREAAADEFTVAGFNIENFAASDATQLTKASLAIRELMRLPDVIGHIEILDLASLQTLASRVNADAAAAGLPDPAYQATLIPAPLGGTQNVGFLVKTSRVRIDQVSQERGADTFINPVNGQSETLHDRPPLVLYATVDPSGLNPRRAIVVVNHLRSFIDVELVGGEGVRVRAKRKAQAESVAGLLQELQTVNAGTAVISIGDYNAYQFSDGYTDPIATLKGMPTPDEQLVVDASPDLVTPDFSNLTDTLPLAEQYSFIFEGTPQALDHVLVNTVAASYASGYAIVRGNSDFPESFAADATRPERSSDHDMPVAYFRFPPPSTDLRLTKAADATSVAAGGAVSYTLVVSNTGTAPAQNVVVTDPLAAGITFASCSATEGGTCGGSPSVPTVTFPLLAPGSSAAITITGTLGCATPNGATLTNVATVASTTADTDATNDAASASIGVVNAAPTITGAAPSRSQLLLPLSQMVPVDIAYTAADTCGAVTTTLSVTSDEPVTGSLLQHGLAGLTSPDWQIVDPRRVMLRSEYSLRGDGRVYSVRITATDAAGGSTSETVTVTVPRLIGW